VIVVISFVHFHGDSVGKISVEIVESGDHLVDLDVVNLHSIEVDIVGLVAGQFVLELVDNVGDLLDDFPED